MKAHWTYTLHWNNRYIPCPGKEVLFSIDVPPGAPCPVEITEASKPGNGYSIGINFHPDPPKQLSKAALSSVRKKRLVRKVHKKYPLFADEFIGRELNKRTEYFAGVRS